MNMSELIDNMADVLIHNIPAGVKIVSYGESVWINFCGMDERVEC